jgi:hypothetical protein
MKTEHKPYHLAARGPAGAKLGVDRNTGTVNGVALITVGEAKGHGIYIDGKTLTTALEVLKDKGGQLKCASRHLSWDEYFSKRGDRVEDFPGWFSGAAIKGDQLIAEKLEFFDSFKTGDATKALFTRFLEMADKTPELFGVSLEPWGYLSYVGKDGVEYTERPKDIELKYDGLPALRVTDLFYGALVDEPAANPRGLFAQLSAKFSDSEFVAALRSLFAGEQPALDTRTGLPGTSGPIGPAGVTIPALTAPKPPAAANVVNPAASSETPALSASMKDILNHINATFSADKAKHAQALSIFAAKPEITVEALGAEMQKQDLAALGLQVTNLTTRTTELSTQVTNLTAERDEWKGKFEKLRNSGAVAEVPLGAPNGGGAQDNPWLEGPTKNLSRQAEITKANPALAKQLEAAAKNPAAAAAAPAAK